MPRQTLYVSMLLVAAGLVATPLTALGQTEFPTMEEAILLIPEQMRHNMRFQMEKRLREKAKDPEIVRELPAVYPVEYKLTYLQDLLINKAYPADLSTGINPLDVSRSTLGDCQEVLSMPAGAAIGEGRKVNGLQRFFTCPALDAIIRMEEYAMRAGHAQVFLLREMTTTDLNVNNIVRRAVLTRYQDAADHRLTRLSWRHGDRVVHLEVTGTDAEQEQQLRQIAATLPPSADTR